MKRILHLLVLNKKINKKRGKKTPIFFQFVESLEVRDRGMNKINNEPLAPSLPLFGPLPPVTTRCHPNETSDEMIPPPRYKARNEVGPMSLLKRLRFRGRAFSWISLDRSSGKVWCKGKKRFEKNLRYNTWSYEI